MGQLRKLVEFEKSVLRLKEEMEAHIRYLYWEIELDTEAETISWDEYINMIERVEAKLVRMEGVMKDRLGEMLLTALDVSKAALGVKGE